MMIRVLFFLLVLINIIVLASFKLLGDDIGTSSVQRVVTQINPGAIKLLNDNKNPNSKLNSLLGNSIATQNQDENAISTCIEANLANENEVTFMQKEMQNLIPNVQTKVIANSQNGSYVVYVKSIKSVKDQIATLRQAKVSPISTTILNKKIVVATGIFSDKPRALEYIEKLKSKGSSGLDVEKIGIGGNLNIFWVRIPYAGINEEGLMRKISNKHGIFSRYCKD
jgi:hypothetical protein